MDPLLVCCDLKGHRRLGAAKGFFGAPPLLPYIAL